VAIGLSDEKAGPFCINTPGHWDAANSGVSPNGAAPAGWHQREPEFFWQR
jgi:hypothetical protein